MKEIIKQEPVGEIMDLKQTATYLHISVNYLYKLNYLKKIPHYKPLPNGKRVLYRKSDLDAMIMQGRVKTANEIEQEAIDYSSLGRNI